MSVAQAAACVLVFWQFDAGDAFRVEKGLEVLLLTAIGNSTDEEFQVQSLALFLLFAHQQYTQYYYIITPAALPHSTSPKDCTSPSPMTIPSTESPSRLI